MGSIHWGSLFLGALLLWVITKFIAKKAAA